MKFIKSSLSWLAPLIRIQVLAFFGVWVLRFINRSVYWKRIGYAGQNETGWACGEPRIIIFWHGHQLFMPWIYLESRNLGVARDIFTLNSVSSDGRIAVRILKYLGIKSVAGSSSRGGRGAVRSLLRCLRDGNHIAITPDGPKGPSHKLKPGVIRIAEHSGAAIYPAALGAEKKWQIKSWDNMFIPKPLSRGVMILGDPIRIPHLANDDELATWTGKVEAALNEVTQQASNYNYA